MSERRRHQVYLSLGANLGQRQSTLQAACRALGDELTAVVCSPLYETDPWGPIAQPDFLNMCLAGQTTLAPRALLHFLKQTERRLGRLPGERWGPRLIDIDLLLYDDITLNEPGLTIPHPRLVERAFVLVPLLNIAPNIAHPATGHPLRHALADLDTDSVRPVTERLGPLVSDGN